MQYTGEGAKGILIIGEVPSNEDDRAGKQFTDSGGKMLRQELRKLGIMLDRDCWKANAMSCRTPLDAKGKTTQPTPKQVRSCAPYIEGIIKTLKPRKIILLGDVALQSFYGDRNTQCTSTYKMAGLKLWDSTHNAWILPLWSPRFIKSREHDVLLLSEFKRCIAKAVEADDTPLKKRWNPIHKLRDFKQAKEALTLCLQHDTLIAIDYETTGLDMYRKGHKTASFAWANDKGAWAVPVQHPYWKKKQQDVIFGLVQKILKKRKIKKIVQGINFEYPWTKQQMKVEPRNFFWDTQLATHVLDSRTGITGLKFQCFLRWGIEEYDALSKKYIKSDKNNDGFNNMLKMPVDALLEYNALDSLYTYELYKEQLGEFVGDEIKAYSFLHSGAIVMCEMSFNGISIKESFYLKQKVLLEQERDDLIDLIDNSREARMYIKKYGKKFDYNSPKDLQIMLFKVLMLDSIKETKTGHSVDEEVLTKMDMDFTANIIAVRKLNKMIGTYVDGFLKHTHDGMMHPSFSLARARSFRSSSQSPNFQNVPKRDPKAKRITRSGMVPRPGRVLGEMDFSGAEISVSCYMHKDPTFIAYQKEGAGDMHRDASAYVLKIDGEEVPKQVRQCTKGVWTFSQFYGSYYVSCAKQGWSDYPLCVDDDNKPVQIRGMDVGKYMKKTFKSYKGFENHLKKFQSVFWDEWFPVYTQWKEDICKEYQTLGYIETPLGFRFKGLMDNKQATNYIVQGTSFHLLVHTAVAFWKECRRRGMLTLIVGQVHDSLILDIPVDEIDDVKEILKTIVGDLHTIYKWMDFPMGLDLEISDPYEQGGSFASMEALEL